MIRSPSVRFIRVAFVVLSASIAIPAAAMAQGAAGGSLGNDNKSLSGASEERRSAAPALRERSERRETPRRETRRSGGGGGGNNFDGAWMVTAVGVTCSGSSTNAVVVTSGRIIGNRVTSGTVSPSGAVNATGGGDGITSVTTGRLSGRSGGGTFKQSDGCIGRWTASKQ